MIKVMNSIFLCYENVIFRYLLSEIFISNYNFETYVFNAEEFAIRNIKYSGRDNLYVRFINEILNDTFSNLAESQPKAFE